MHEAEVTFKFRGLTKAGLAKLYERFPPPEGRRPRLGRGGGRARAAGGPPWSR
jgi:hypothetical protein